VTVVGQILALVLVSIWEIFIWNGEADTFVNGNNQRYQIYAGSAAVWQRFGSGGWKDQQDLTHTQVGYIPMPLSFVGVELLAMLACSSFTSGVIVKVTEEEVSARG
jgi:hypothetical protein